MGNTVNAQTLRAFSWLNKKKEPVCANKNTREKFPNDELCFEEEEPEFPAFNSH